jgi:hypothetical protein
MKARGRKESFAVADPLAGCGTAEAPSQAAIDLANLDHCEMVPVRQSVLPRATINSLTTHQKASLMGG